MSSSALEQLGVPLLTVKAYAELKGLSERQVQRYRADGRLPGAQQDGPRGNWYIPADVEPTSATSSREVVPAPAPVGVAGALERLPVYVDVETAAHLLGVSAYIVRKNADELGGRRWGEDGAWVIPQATIRAHAGL